MNPKLEQLNSLAAKVSFYSFLFFFLAFPLSVSASQVLAGLTIFAFLFSGRKCLSEIRPYLFPWALILGAYFLVFVSSIYHWEEYHRFWKTFTRQSEAGDFWLALIFPIAAVHSSRGENRKLIHRFLWISFCLVLVSGIASVFSEYRLGKFISNGFAPAPGDRRQHPAGPLFGIATYLPIGLMNTHLTYGGLLSLYLPGLFLLLLLSAKERKWKESLVLGGLVLLASWVFFLNQSKSAWLGVISVIGFFFLSNRDRFRNILPRLSASRIAILLALLLTATGSMYFLFQKNWLLQRTFSQLTSIQTPENQRYWIYKLSLPLLERNPVLGVGGGRFKEVTGEEEIPLVQKHEQLWYELFITPNKHAHNDLLQFAIVGGWLSAILWMGFFFLLFRKLGTMEWKRDSFPLLGLGFVWVAGFFQCYLLDDEVALPFFALAGVLWGREKERKEESKFAILFLTITFLLNASFWIWRLWIPPELAYSRQVFASSQKLASALEARILPFRSSEKERQRRTRESLSVSPEEASAEFSVEGCLTHRYPNPTFLRKEPYSFGVYLAPDAKNSPRKMSVTVFSEESFDEDKLYWSHRKYDIESKEIPLSIGWNPFVWEETVSLAKQTVFPEIVFFRSFKIRFSDFRENEPVELPALDFGDLCDFKKE
ncbi:O-antigen ligase family protein [Leptospira wolffii]|uniref:O-antigen ligase family protein n=1 Tax=Leptospira wolffii TaxID=409998 RepID=A0ABV5BTM7_9LEPT|nr:O-antigen ligase family protein [Leptospira wolffii]TGL53922.1 ligase [Leptospira wolffii]